MPDIYVIYFHITMAAFSLKSFSDMDDTYTWNDIDDFTEYPTYQSFYGTFNHNILSTEF